MLSVLLRYTDSDYTFGILWPLCRLLLFDIGIRITPLVSFGHCVVCSSLIYRFWLPLWYILTIVLSVLLRYTDSDYPFGIFWPLCCQFFFDIRIQITPLVSFGHCVVSSSIYRIWLPLWYLLAIVSSALLWYTDSHYPFGIFWPLCRLLFFDLQILITPLVYFDHCVVSSSSIYRFWLPLWYILTIVLSVLLRYTDSDYPVGIFWPLCCQFFFDIGILITSLVSLAIVLSVLLRYTDSDYTFGIFRPLCRLSFFDIRILNTPLVSFGHCVVCSSLMYRFWLPLWYLLAIVLSVLWYTDSDYSFGIFLLLCCQFFFDIGIRIYPFGICWPLRCQFLLDIGIRITPLVSFGHCVVSSSSIYIFWLPLWYLLAIVLSVLLRYTDSDCPVGIFWPLCCQFFFDVRILITSLVSFGQCVVSSSSIYGFRLHLWYLLAIMSSVLLWYTDSEYPFGIFWPFCRLLFFDIQILITPLVSFGNCVVSSSIYRFWLPIWYLFAIVLSVLLRYRDSDLPLWYLLTIVLSVLLRYTNSDYPFGIFWPFCRLLFFDIHILITPLVSFGNCVVSSSIYRFWLPIWYLFAIVLSVLLRYRDSYLTFWYLLAIVLSVLLRYTNSDYPFGIFWPLCRFSSLIYRFWLPLWYLLIIVSSALLRYTDSDYPFGIFWPLYRQFFFDIGILITLWYVLAIVLSVLLRYTNSVYPFGIIWPLCRFSSLIYRFWLPLWYLLTIVSSALLRYTDSDYPLVSFGHCVVCFSSIYRFWLPLWYLVAIVSSALILYMDSDYPFGIFWPLCCQFFFYIQILITPLVSFGHCVDSASSIYGFWLPLWYLLAIMLSVLLRYTDSDYPFGIFWPLCCQFLFDIGIRITPLVSFGHCVVSSSSTYGFWLPLWYLVAIVLSVLLRYTDSDYPFGICWPLCCRFIFDIGIRITLLVSFGHCVVSSSSIYIFWLPLWYLLAIVLSVLLR